MMSSRAPRAARFVELIIAIGSLFVFSSIAHRSEPVLAQQSGAGANTFMWKDPGAIETKDTFMASGSDAGKPAPPLKFSSENLKGTSPKALAIDANGVNWDVKFGPDARSDTAANRLLWTLGFLVGETYFMPTGHFDDVQGQLQRIAKYVSADGSFHDARFRKRHPDVEEIGEWSFDSNPFVGTKELSGLILLAALFNNWDTSGTHNKEILRVKFPDGHQERWFTMLDQDACFGRMIGPKGTVVQWTPSSFQEENYIQRVEGGQVYINYAATGFPPKSVPVDHARWFASLVNRLQEAQIRRAFEAAAATPAEVDAFTAKIKQKVAELNRALGAPTSAPTVH